MRKYKISWFTLVEIVIVIVLLVILSSIAFYSYVNHVKWGRDATRVWELTQIWNWLSSLKVTNILPFPSNYINVVASWAEVWYQWYLDQKIINIIWYNENGKDPLDGFYYTYYLTSDLKLFQLLSYLEEPDSLDSFNFIDKAYAVDYSLRFPKVYGDKLWILTTLLNAPIQEDTLIKTTKIVDIVKTLIPYRAYFTDKDYIEWTWWVLYVTNPTSSCRRIIETKWWMFNSKQIINPDWVDIEVYCNSNYMDTNFTWAEMLPPMQ